MRYTEWSSDVCYSDLLDPHADARRRAGGDHFARLQTHELRDVGDVRPVVYDHRLRRAVLAHDPVHAQPHLEVLRVGDLFARDEPRPDGSEAVGGLALGPLAATIGLEGALRDVVDHAVAVHVVHGVDL